MLEGPRAQSLDLLLSPFMLPSLVTSSSLMALSNIYISMTHKFISLPGFLQLICLTAYLISPCGYLIGISNLICPKLSLDIKPQICFSCSLLSLSNFQMLSSRWSDQNPYFPSHLTSNPLGNLGSTSEIHVVSITSHHFPCYHPTLHYHHLSLGILHYSSYCCFLP